MRESARNQKSGRRENSGGNDRRSFVRNRGEQTAPGLRRALGNQAEITIAGSESSEEQHARSVGDHLLRLPDGPASPLADPSSGVTTLSDAGRRYFGPLVGEGVDRARLHVGGGADRLAYLAGAEALTVGRDIFIPKARFSPESPEGRALLGHELAHAGERESGKPKLYRKDKPEPRYPSESERREIETILERDFEESDPSVLEASEARESGDLAIDKGRSLNDAERQAMADRLAEPFLRALNGLGTGGEEMGTALDEAEAFKAVTEARDAIFKRFGEYAFRAVELTQDTATTIADRKKNNQLLITFESTASAADALARTIVDTHCKECQKELAGLDDASRRAVRTRITDAAMRDHGDKLRRAAQANVGGSHSRSTELVNIGLTTRESLYGTAVHELMHSLAHPAFHAAFDDERDIIEGFTEYFTRQVVPTDRNTTYPIPFSKVSSVKSALSGPFSYGGGPSGEESLREAYFRGRLDLIGWRPTGPAEQKAVEAAGGAAEWDPDVARTHEATYRSQAIAAQDPSRNVLGMGFYFSQGATENLISVRYARVLLRDEPYATKQLTLEGQVIGGPVQDPKAIGGSIGLGVEYQAPYFYTTGGLRFMGTAIPSEDERRFDITPYAGIGFRAWQTIRVGAEGFVLLPVGGGDIGVGGGLSVGIELGK